MTTAGSEELRLKVPGTLRLSWPELPTEIHLMILRCLADEPAGDGHRQSAYAVVCREWQRFFEPVLFKNLVLHQSDVKRLGDVVRNNRITYVKWIWLRLELPAYTCTQCKNPESSDEYQRHNQLFTNAVWELFAVLSAWKGRDTEDGITFELSAHSPSDWLHCYKPLQRRIHDTAWAWKHDRLGEGQTFHDPKHGWELTQTKRPKLAPLLRLFGRPEGLKFDRRASWARRIKKLPRVNIIKAFCIRRQFLRMFSVVGALSPMIRSTPAITSFRYEVWRAQSRASHPGVEIRHKDHLFLLSNVLHKQLKQLKRISIYQNCDSLLHKVHFCGQSPSLGRALALSSYGLEELHVGKLLDARDFFHDFWPVSETGRRMQLSRGGRKWENLRSLSLSSQFLNHMDIEDLMSAASSAAIMMPCLQIMELWIGFRGAMCVFRYQRRTNAIEIELLSTWNARITPLIHKQWARVANCHNSRVDMESVNNDVDPGLIKGEACVLQYLVCKHKLLNEVSLLQIQEEQNESASRPGR
ncbi:hypothetical protein F5Y18DRAFT_438949 [Xylariaceae sp. FL1019]|nr:hypothetical protein F5Y18DRAFT_438949 [Xylariaceae sp. FL1019]